ncbi:MAG: ABC transporter ATP-binding protein [Pseudomonadota bacterium]
MDGDVLPAQPPSAVPAEAAPPIIRLRAVSKTFDNGTHALDGVDLDVADGEFLSLLGPSGCGKSTILRLIAGLEAPSEGEMQRQKTGAGQDVGFVFQEPTLMPWARVFENVWLPLRLKGASRREAEPRVMDALESVGLSDFRSAFPRELSGGMKMRVSIARALATDPSILLMDEPFAALDEITRFRLNDDLLELWDAKGWTVVFVTHSVFESVFLSTRIAVMTGRPGRIATCLEIDEPSPRSESFRTSARYGEIARDTSKALHAAMAA